jgi:hypothetical protein
LEVYDDMPDEVLPSDTQVPFVRRLAQKEEWIIEKYGEDHILAGLWEYPEGYVSWEKIALSDLPNDLISSDDLVRFGITRDRLHDVSSRNDL